MAKTGLENKRVREMEEEELTILRAEVDTYMIEGDLRRFNMLNIKRLKEIQCYRGRRHIRGLPCRGQRTKTNARTRRVRSRPSPARRSNLSVERIISSIPRRIPRKVSDLVRFFV
jgi:small subunit ribosomal protein S13